MRAPRRQDEEADDADTRDDAGNEPEDPLLEEEDLSVTRGMNRFVWDLRAPGPDVIGSAPSSRWPTRAGRGFRRATTRFASRSATRSKRSRPASTPIPRITTSVTAADLQAQYALTIRIRDRLSEVHDAIREARSIREQTGRLRRPRRRR